MKRFILNPKYILRSEDDKVYILINQKYEKKVTASVIHPVYAMMLSFFNGDDLENILENISSFFKIKKEIAKNIFMKLIDKNEYITNGESVFPPHIIIKYEEGIPIPPYKPSDFKYTNVDIQMSRFKSPSDIICNITMKCITACIYCYADRKGNQDKIMDIELLEKIIDEAKNIGVLRFQLMGGEVLLYKDWKRILTKMSNLEFQPSISTKIPLTKEHISTIKELGLNEAPIQLSVDTLIKNHLYDILKVKDPYYKNLLNTFNLLEEYEMKYIIHTVICNQNDSIEDVDSLVNFFKERKHLDFWAFDTAKCSMYIGKSYDSYKTTRYKVEEIRKYLDEINNLNLFNFKIKKPEIIRNPNEYTKEEKENMFKNRTMCSGNLNALYILPDGKVSICEELYWHPRFLLGDLKKQSIMEIWNSRKAKELFYLKQTDIPEDSPCAACEEYTECRRFKHVCWRDTILAYGKNKWYYPDIFCPKAPFIEKNISL